eukprot:TRINITY_DN59753_c0_g4_i1.p1 TRINITY_DN59753_c0_g4~~TRINITY_DN59753_c0_g4_i1.p1  ORF type:complete len:2149 (-),score=387.78 TRINITY_DN59753_c0_g4_i1:165-6611(-)
MALEHLGVEARADRQGCQPSCGKRRLHTGCATSHNAESAGMRHPKRRRSLGGGCAVLARLLESTADVMACTKGGKTLRQSVLKSYQELLQRMDAGASTTASASSAEDGTALLAYFKDVRAVVPATSAGHLEKLWLRTAGTLERLQQHGDAWQLCVELVDHLKAQSCEDSVDLRNLRVHAAVRAASIAAGVGKTTELRASDLLAVCQLLRGSLLGESATAVHAPPCVPQLDASKLLAAALRCASCMPARSGTELELTQCWQMTLELLEQGFSQRDLEHGRRAAEVADALHQQQDISSRFKVGIMQRLWQLRDSSLKTAQCSGQTPRDAEAQAASNVGTHWLRVADLLLRALLACGQEPALREDAPLLMQHHELAQDVVAWAAKCTVAGAEGRKVCLVLGMVQHAVTAWAAVAGQPGTSRVAGNAATAVQMALNGLHGLEGKASQRAAAAQIHRSAESLRRAVAADVLKRRPSAALTGPPAQDGSLLRELCAMSCHLCELFLTIGRAVRMPVVSTDCASPSRQHAGMSSKFRMTSSAMATFAADLLCNAALEAAMQGQLEDVNREASRVAAALWLPTEDQAAQAAFLRHMREFLHMQQPDSKSGVVLTVLSAVVGQLAAGSHKALVAPLQQHLLHEVSRCVDALFASGAWRHDLETCSRLSRLCTWASKGVGPTPEADGATVAKYMLALRLRTQLAVTRETLRQLPSSRCRPVLKRTDSTSSQSSGEEAAQCAASETQGEIVVDCLRWAASYLDSDTAQRGLDGLEACPDVLRCLCSSMEAFGEPSIEQLELLQLELEVLDSQLQKFQKVGRVADSLPVLLLALKQLTLCADWTGFASKLADDGCALPQTSNVAAWALRCGFCVLSIRGGQLSCLAKDQQETYRHVHQKLLEACRRWLAGLSASPLLCSQPPLVAARLELLQAHMASIQQRQASCGKTPSPSQHAIAAAKLLLDAAGLSSLLQTVDFGYARSWLTTTHVHEDVARDFAKELADVADLLELMEEFQVAAAALSGSLLLRGGCWIEGPPSQPGDDSEGEATLLLLFRLVASLSRAYKAGDAQSEHAMQNIKDWWVVASRLHARLQYPSSAAQCEALCHCVELLPSEDAGETASVFAECVRVCRTAVEVASVCTDAAASTPSAATLQAAAEVVAGCRSHDADVEGLGVLAQRATLRSLDLLRQQQQSSHAGRGKKDCTLAGDSLRRGFQLMDRCRLELRILHQAAELYARLGIPQWADYYYTASLHLVARAVPAASHWRLRALCGRARLALAGWPCRRLSSSASSSAAEDDDSTIGLPPHDLLEPLVDVERCWNDEFSGVPRVQLLVEDAAFLRELHRFPVQMQDVLLGVALRTQRPEHELLRRDHGCVLRKLIEDGTWRRLSLASFAKVLELDGSALVQAGDVDNSSWRPVILWCAGLFQRPVLPSGSVHVLAALAEAATCRLREVRWSSWQAEELQEIQHVLDSAVAFVRGRACSATSFLKEHADGIVRDFLDGFRSQCGPALLKDAIALNVATLHFALQHGSAVLARAAAMRAMSILDLASEAVSNEPFQDIAATAAEQVSTARSERRCFRRRRVDEALAVLSASIVPFCSGLNVLFLQELHGVDHALSPGVERRNFWADLRTGRWLSRMVDPCCHIAWLHTDPDLGILRIARLVPVDSATDDAAHHGGQPMVYCQAVQLTAAKLKELEVELEHVEEAHRATVHRWQTAAAEDKTSQQGKSSFWSACRELDSRIMHFSLELQDDVMQELRFLLAAPPSSAEQAERMSAAFEDWCRLQQLHLAELQKRHGGACDMSRMSRSVLKVLYLTVDEMPLAMAMRAMARVLSCQTSSHLQSLAESMQRHRSALRRSGNDDKAPLVLFVDSTIAQFPLEGCPCLENQPIARNLAANVLLSAIDEATRRARPARGYYVLDPAGDTSAGRHVVPALQGWPKEIPANSGRPHVSTWRGWLGHPQPSSDELAKRLTDAAALLFMGHVDHAQRLLRLGKTHRFSSRSCARLGSVHPNTSGGLQKLGSRHCTPPVALIMACSSAKLFRPQAQTPGHRLGSCRSEPIDAVLSALSEQRTAEQFEAFGMPLSLHFSGSLSVFGALRDVLGGDLDQLAAAMLQAWAKAPPDDYCSLLRALGTARRGRACLLPHLTAASVVCYGLPV